MGKVNKGIGFLFFLLLRVDVFMVVWVMLPPYIRNVRIERVDGDITCLLYQNKKQRESRKFKMSKLSNTDPVRTRLEPSNISPCIKRYF